MRLAVGAFVGEFTQLEMMAHAYVIHLSKDKLLGSKAAAQEFSRRVGTLIEMSRERAPVKLRKRWIDIWQRALVLAEHRNNICHNPPTASIYVNAKGELMVKGVALHLYKSKGRFEGAHYTARQIRSYARQANRLNTRVLKMLGEWRKATPRARI